MSTGRYIRRAAGYFIKLLVLVGVLYLLMFVTGTARVSAEFFFREMVATPRGVLLLAALALLAAFYPKFGYVRRRAEADIVADREQVIRAFHAAGYVVTEEEPGVSMTFRAGSFFRRLWLTFDDRVTVTAAEGGIIIEGLRKEAVHAQFRINTYIQNRNYGKRD